MWDFLATILPMLKEKLGKHFNRIVVLVAVSCVGWYAHVATSKVIALLNEVVAVEVSLKAHGDALQKIHMQVGTLQSDMKTIQSTQVTTAADIQKVSKQMATLQAVLVNRLNLILPPLGETDRQLETSLCSTQ